LFKVSFKPSSVNLLIRHVHDSIPYQYTCCLDMLNILSGN